MNFQKIKDHALGYVTYFGIALLGILLFAGIQNGCSYVQGLWGWQLFHSEEGRFTVRMPKDPIQKTLQGRMNGPRFKEFKAFMAERAGSSYIVGYGDEFEDILKQFTSEEILDAARDGVLVSTQSQLLIELRVLKNGFVGREIKVTTSGLTERFQIYVVGKRKYVAGVLARSSVRSKNDEQFFNTFQFFPMPSVVPTAVEK